MKSEVVNKRVIVKRLKALGFNASVNPEYSPFIRGLSVPPVTFAIEVTGDLKIKFWYIQGMACVQVPENYQRIFSDKSFDNVDKAMFYIAEIKNTVVK